MTYYIEHDFPIEQLNPLSRREANGEPAIAELDSRLDAFDLTEMTELYRARGSLEIERDVVARIPT